MKYNTIIFDLDGTLLNTLEDLKDSTNYALRKMGYEERTLDEVRSFVGNGVKVLIEKAVPFGTSINDTLKCLEIFRSHYTNNIQNKTCPYHGIMELLESLVKKNYKLAIVSNKFDAAVKMLCQDYFNESIKVAIGESPSVAKKPAPDTVFKAINELGSTIEDSVYVGDSEVDVQTAHNASIKCIGVTWGFRTKKILESEGADYIVETVEELLELIIN